MEEEEEGQSHLSFSFHLHLRASLMERALLALTSAEDAYNEMRSPRMELSAKVSSVRTQERLF